LAAAEAAHDKERRLRCDRPSAVRLWVSSSPSLLNPAWANSAGRLLQPRRFNARVGYKVQMMRPRPTAFGPLGLAGRNPTARRRLKFEASDFNFNA
jgi:hypothetical protein